MQVDQGGYTAYKEQHKEAGVGLGKEVGWMFAPHSFDLFPQWWSCKLKVNPFNLQEYFVMDLSSCDCSQDYCCFCSFFFFFYHNLASSYKWLLWLNNEVGNQRLVEESSVLFCYANLFLISWKGCLGTFYLNVGFNYMEPYPVSQVLDFLSPMPPLSFEAASEVSFKASIFSQYPAKLSGKL